MFSPSCDLDTPRTQQSKLGEALATGHTIKLEQSLKTGFGFLVPKLSISRVLSPETVERRVQAAKLTKSRLQQRKIIIKRLEKAKQPWFFFNIFGMPDCQLSVPNTNAMCLQYPDSHSCPEGWEERATHVTATKGYVRILCRHLVYVWNLLIEFPRLVTHWALRNLGDGQSILE